MKELDLVIHNPSGLHARPAKVFVNTAKKFKSNIKLQHGAKKVNAKSMISILTLGVESGGQIRIMVDGPDEDEALAILKAAVEEGLGDEHPPQDGGGAKKKNTVDSPPTSESVTAKGQPQAKPAPSPEPISDESIVRGVPASAGIAIGPLHQFRRAEIVVPDKPASDPAKKNRIYKWLFNRP